MFSHIFLYICVVASGRRKAVITIVNIRLIFGTFEEFIAAEAYKITLTNKSNPVQ